MRALSLHISALNDSEHDSYTDALNDLTADANSGPATDEYYDKISVGVREVRAWLRGRYSSLPIADVDAILKLFSPTLSPKDEVNGGQFFAVMRLVMHARDGKGIEKSFAFIQAHPESISPSPVRPAAVNKPPPPPPPARRFSQVSAFSEPDHNPFRAVAGKPQPPTKPPMHPDRPDMSISTPSSLSLAPPKSTNPFLSRSKSDGRTHESAKPKLPPLPPRKPSFLLTALQQQQPPPPPPLRSAPLPSSTAGKSTKPAHILSPLMGRSLEASRAAHSQRKAEESLESARVLQVLKSSSMNASATSLRYHSSSPTRLGSSSTTVSTSSASSSDGRSSYSSRPFGNLPVLPPRLKRPGSVTDSNKSFEQVAQASVEGRRYSRSSTVTPLISRSPERGRPMSAVVDVDEHRDHSSSPTRHTNITAPPTHPDRKPPPISIEPHSAHSIASSNYPISPTSPRIFRSKSMHHQPKLPPPPPSHNARKRPESEQLSPAASMFNLNSAGAPDTPAKTVFTGLSRHASFSSKPHSRASSIDSSPIKRNIQKTLSSFQPKLDAARYKAEAGLSRKGYVNHNTPGFRNWAAEGEQSLIDDDDSVTVDNSGSFSFDDEADGPFASPKPAGASSGRSKVLGDGTLERDEMKWPVGDGDGWKPL